MNAAKIQLFRRMANQTTDRFAQQMGRQELRFFAAQLIAAGC